MVEVINYLRKKDNPDYYKKYYQKNIKKYLKRTKRRLVVNVVRKLQDTTCQSTKNQKLTKE